MHGKKSKILNLIKQKKIVPGSWKNFRDSFIVGTLSDSLHKIYSIVPSTLNFRRSICINDFSYGILNRERYENAFPFLADSKKKLYKWKVSFMNAFQIL